MTTHFAVALLPAAIGIDAAARMRDDEDLYRLGRATMVAASGAALVTTATGLVAEREVQGGEEARSMLRTHKSLNLANGGLTTAMTAYRLRRRPGWGYLATGAGALGVMIYGAYLGGRMVYGEGMGVEKAQGLRNDQAPRIRPGNFKNAFATFGRQLARGVGELFRGLIPRVSAPIEEDYVSDRLRRDNERPGALRIGSTR